METVLREWFDVRYVSIEWHETCDGDKLVCRACEDLLIGGPTCIVESARGDRTRYYLHKSCAELPASILHPLHPQHPLIVSHCRDSFICDGCRHVSFGYQFRCSKKCRFKLDFRCASKNEGQALKERVQKQTDYHRHEFQLVYFHSPMPTDLPIDLVCCCCLKSCPDGRDPTYSCNVCFNSKNPFLIHKSCLDTLPQQVQSSFHPEHPLFTRLLEAAKYNCGVCYDKFTGFALACKKCDIKFHVSCGSRSTRGLRVDDLHEHDMYYVVLRTPDLHPCTLCRAGCEGAFYRCVKCDVNVHMECIPLPEIVEHESHEYHPLKLTDSVVTHRDDDEYRCDICEEQGNIKHHSYYCKECNFIAHIECVHSEHQDDTSETKDAEVETDDADIKNDDAEKKSKDEVHDSQEGLDSEDFCDDQQYDESNEDDRIENFRTKIEKLASELEAVANLDQRIEKVKADMVKLFDDLMEEFIKIRKKELGLYT